MGKSSLSGLKVVVSVLAIIFAGLVAIDALDASQYGFFADIATILFIIAGALLVASILQISFRKDSSWKVFIPAALYVVCAVIGFCTLGNIGDGSLITFGSLIFGVISGLIALPAVLKK